MELTHGANDGKRRDDGLEVHHKVEVLEVAVIVVATWRSRRPTKCMGKNTPYPATNVVRSGRIQFGVHHAAKHLGVPVVNARKHAENGTHAHHNVEVRHHEVRVVHVHVQRRVGEDDACQTTVTNVLTKPMLKSMAGVNRRLPCHNVVM